MATLSLVTDSQGTLQLHSDTPSHNAEFSVFDLDGGGSGSPFDYGTNTWTAVEGIEKIEYDADDSDNDSFWEAQQYILKECIAKGILLPEYAEIW